jgi:hypothetical protein
MRDLDPGPVPQRESCCPCHRLPVAGGPARVWCRVSGRQFHADDPGLRRDCSRQPNANAA